MINLISEKFEQIIKREEEKIKLETSSFNILGTLRLISFIVIVYFLYKYIKDSLDMYLYLLFLNIFIFIVLIVFHGKVKSRLNFSRRTIDINKRYLDRINGKWTDFKDIGEEFIDKSHRYSSDLDIVGKRSLFQLINLTHTFYGRKILAGDLLNAKYTEEEINLRQEAISELKDKLEFCQALELKSSNDDIKDPQELIQYFNNNEEVYSKNIITILRILPIFVILLSTTVILFKIQSLYRLVFFLFALHSIIWLTGFNKNNLLLEKVDYLSNSLESYVGILLLIEKEEFKSTLLKDIKEKLLGEELSALTSIERLEMIGQMISIRSNGLIYILLNVLILWDYQASFFLEAWKKRFGQHVETWLHVIGTLESLISLTVPMQIEDGLTFPKINNKEFRIKAKNIGHPLIKKDERIYNDISIYDKILIITGSNMSGKTTFLRTIGINIVLTNAGSAVFSSQLSIPLMDIYTSMRITDDLKNRISTFYGELLRIKNILDYAKTNKNTFFLIDEIFRGTNSKDRIYGAKNVLRNLNKAGLMGAITTHDLELCTLESDNRIINYNFSENYIDGKINFDYKIRKGKSTSTNAKYLMNFVGIDLIE